eukprot:scaffold10186_cov44-Cyclotella_meneghiniana.AAC.4
MEGDLPREVYVRPSSANNYRYYVGDASREGQGGATQFPNGSIRGRRAVWLKTFAEGGSNLREATAQVNHLINEIQTGVHDGCAVWAFTDNAVWSVVWLKGLSTAKHLFELTLKLKIECRVHEPELMDGQGVTLRRASLWAMTCETIYPLLSQPLMWPMSHSGLGCKVGWEVIIQSLCLQWDGSGTAISLEYIFGLLHREQL